MDSTQSWKLPRPPLFLPSTFCLRFSQLLSRSSVPRVSNGKAELDRVHGVVPVATEAFHGPPRVLVHEQIAGTIVAISITMSTVVPVAVTRIVGSVSPS